jgi:hypothetical protein
VPREENKALVRRYLTDAPAEVRSAKLSATGQLLADDAAFYREALKRRWGSVYWQYL